MNSDWIRTLIWRRLWFCVLRLCTMRGIFPWLSPNNIRARFCFTSSPSPAVWRLAVCASFYTKTPGMASKISVRACCSLCGKNPFWTVKR